MTSSFRGSLHTDWARLWQGAALAGIVGTASVLAAPPSQDAAPRITPGVSVVVHADGEGTSPAPRSAAPRAATAPVAPVPSAGSSRRQLVIQQVAADDEQSAVQQRLQELYQREGKTMPDQDWSYEMRSPAQSAGQPSMPGQMPQGVMVEPKRGFFDRFVPGFLRKNTSSQQTFSIPPQPGQFAQPQMMPPQHPAQPQFVQPQVAQPAPRPSGFRFPWQKAPQPRQFAMPQGTPAQVPTGPVRNPTGEFATRSPAAVPAPQPTYGSPYLTPPNQGATAPQLSTTDGDQPTLMAPGTLAGPLADSAASAQNPLSEPALLSGPDESTPLASQPQLSSPSVGDDDPFGGPDQQELTNRPALESTDAPQIASPSPDQSVDGPQLSAKPSFGGDLLLEEPKGVDNDTLDFGGSSATVENDAVEEQLPFGGQKLDTSIETRVASTEPAPGLPADKPQVAETNASTSLPGLKGYCLVTLRNERRLVLARAEYSSEVNGTTYLFASQAAKQTFDENPELYVPAGAGYDVVKQAKGRVAPGSIDHAVWYKGRLFMFDSRETLENFADGPAEFAKVVLNSTAPKVAKPAEAKPATAKPADSATPPTAQPQKQLPDMKVPAAAAPATVQEKLPVLN